MFSFFSKSISSSGILRGLTDAHSHILPGVDDGVAEMDKSLAILREYEAQGITNVWLTPHIMEDIPNTTAELRERFAELQAAYDGPITLHLAAEYMLDGTFEERFRNRDLLTHSGSNILVETSYFTPPMGFYKTLEEIKKAGYYPILAHPERYIYMDDKAYKHLKHMGVKFQLNLFSLVGQYGPTAEKKAIKLLKEGYYTYIGSDLHRHAALERNLSEKLPKKLLPLLENLK